MFKTSVGLCVVGLLFSYHISFSQVDTSYIYKTGMPYGTLDIRLAKSSARYYYLQEGKTFSFRENSSGVKTNTYRDMTSWDSSPYTQGNLREKNGSQDYFVMNYRLLFPNNYSTAYADGYPIIIMVHGLGERGNCWTGNCYWATSSWNPNTNSPAAPTSASSELLNNDHNLLHGGNIHLQMRNAAGTKLPNDPSLPDRSFPGFVLFPQNLNGWSANSAQDVIRLIRLLTKKYNIDENRIYVHGLSNGGAAVYDMLKRAPWLFSAAAPMSSVSDAAIISQNLTSKISTIPLWIFQGATDGNPTPAKTEGYVKKFREAGLTVRYTKYANLGHGTWNTAYNEPDFFTWLREKNKRNIHVYSDNPTICETTGNGARMDLAEGFLAYQWERNGVIISGATSASYTATTPGTYRARFSRLSKTPNASQWNDWSDPVVVTSSNPVKAEVIQTGTVKLKDLNNYNYAHLSAAAAADHYYWYKDGALVNLPGNVDDTVRHAKFSQGNCTGGPCTGNGVYTLVTAGFNNCPSPPSDPIYIIFNNQAPVNITAPTNFTGNGTSATTATVNWIDASSNETGFEIWRRKQTGSTTFSKWVMAGLTNTNVSTFNDTGLEPSSTYQYKIRAVNNTGRSNYTPSASNQFLVIITGSDTQNPSVPQNLTATSTAIREITLTWQASTDNIGIREYNIYYGSSVVSTGSPATSYKLTNLPLNANFSFTVRAKDLGDNLSGPSNTAAGSTFVTGLYYEHTTGAWTDLDQINWNTAEFTGHVNNFTLAPRTQEDYFNFEFTGYLYISAGGTYQFQTTSDDGSRLTLDNAVLVDNDGTHGTRTITSANVSLTAGAKLINVKYFEDGGGQNLTVRYKGPDTGNNWITIPDAALRSGNSGSSMISSLEVADESSAPDETLFLNIYPNPVNDGKEVTVQVTTQSPEPIKVQLMDFVGTSYFENDFEATEAFQGVTVQPNRKLPKGLYVVRIQQNRQVSRRVLIVKD